MPKKTRKMKQRAALRRSVGVYEENEIVEEVAGEPAPRPRFESTSRAFSPLAYDYSHIYRDLKRIALFAGFFFAVLIVLSFVIK
ncbi:MAG: hypothetical protein HZC40_23080 [Chloroflexi bacterium]|nr:hypothetical protein [Chloroflexota bacterium]